MDARPWPVLLSELTKHERVQAHQYTTSLSRSRLSSVISSCESGPPTYLRVAKTASTSVLDYLHRANCSSHVRAEDHHRTVASRFPASQPLLIVLREPCDRASSILAHWRSLGPSTNKNDGRHLLANLTSYAEYVWRRWRQLNVRLSTRHTIIYDSRILSSLTCAPRRAQAPWSGRTATNALAWMQSRYVNGCTRFLCFGARAPPCVGAIPHRTLHADPSCVSSMHEQAIGSRLVYSDCARARKPSRTRTRPQSPRATASTIRTLPGAHSCVRSTRPTGGCGGRTVAANSIIGKASRADRTLQLKSTTIYEIQCYSHAPRRPSRRRCTCGTTRRASRRASRPPRPRRRWLRTRAR